MAQESGPEKRKYKRVNRRLTARVRPYQKNKKPEESVKWDIVTIRNLSATGVSFNYTQKIALDTILEFKIALPFTAEPLHCLGQICRIDEETMIKIKSRGIPIYWIAVRFIDIDTDKKEAIIKLTGH